MPPRLRCRPRREYGDRGGYGGGGGGYGRGGYDRGYSDRGEQRLILALCFPDPGSMMVTQTFSPIAAQHE